jgi:hypothetical protein
MVPPAKSRVPRFVPAFPEKRHFVVRKKMTLWAADKKKKGGGTLRKIVTRGALRLCGSWMRGMFLLRVDSVHLRWVERGREEERRDR